MYLSDCRQARVYQREGKFVFRLNANGIEKEICRKERHKSLIQYFDTKANFLIEKIKRFYHNFAKYGMKSKLFYNTHYQLNLTFNFNENNVNFLKNDLVILKSSSVITIVVTFLRRDSVLPWDNSSSSNKHSFRLISLRTKKLSFSTNHGHRNKK